MSWNVNFRTGSTALREGEYLQSLEPDLAMLQETSRGSIETLCEAAGFDWYRCSLDYRVPQPDDKRGRSRGCVIAGHGVSPGPGTLINDVPLSERTLVVHVDVDDRRVAVGSFHAPPGVSWFEKKPAQAVKIARWLASLEPPCLFGIDANTPMVDHPDFSRMRTHWHTGSPNLKGEPGDDLLVGPEKIHPLRDALRVWFDTHPVEFESIKARFPEGPLAISHRTGKRKNFPGTPRRFDAIWVSPEFVVRDVQYLYDAAIDAGSDHAAVVADLALGHTVG